MKTRAIPIPERKELFLKWIQNADHPILVTCKKLGVSYKTLSSIIAEGIENNWSERERETLFS
jgi:hypothetical protein